jgi:hypothetical protein
LYSFAVIQFFQEIFKFIDLPVDDGRDISVDRKSSTSLAEIVFSCIIESTGRKANQKNIGDLKTLSVLDSLSISLLKNYPLHIHPLLLFSRFKDEEKRTFLNLVNSKNIKRNLISEYIENLYDIKNRLSFLKDLIIFAENLNKKQKQYKWLWVREKIYIKRYPQIYKHENRIEDMIKSLPKIPHFEILIPENLEDNYFSFSIKAKNQGEFQSVIEKIESENYSERLKPLFKLLHEFEA